MILFRLVPLLVPQPGLSKVIAKKFVQVDVLRNGKFILIRTGR